ncbi:MAG: hypothetical protein H0T59_04570 [Chloroflexi bacterium]|nr:hypothetical protein [Chloroflexota bacterium]
MKRYSILLAIVASLAISATALAAPSGAAPGKNPLTCFGEPTACTSNGKTATINTNNGGAGVYLPGFNTSFYGVRTVLVTKLSNTVTGGALGIDPRWSIPIDANHDGYTNFFAFASFADCNNGAGLVDVINDSTCTIYRDGVAYANWTAMVTANPNDYIALEDNYAFIIADLSGAPGIWTISNVSVGKPGK